MSKIRRLISAIFPPRCPMCGVIVEDDGSFCPNCWKELKFISSPSCVKCDHPFEFEISQDLLCPQCVEEERYFDQALSVLQYDEVSKHIIHQLKFSDRTDLSKQCAILMSRKVKDKYNFIVPVPMHRSRLRRRFYNQSALIASHLGKICDIKVLHNGLMKTKTHDPQTGLSKRARKNNVSGSFAVNPKNLEEIRGSRIVLIDDVYTTGSTVNECSRVLKRAKCTEVTVLTLARVV